MPVKVMLINVDIGQVIDNHSDAVDSGGWGRRSTVWVFLLPLMNNFNNTEAAIPHACCSA